MMTTARQHKSSLCYIRATRRDLQNPIHWISDIWGEGSQTSLSAIKGVNQSFARFTPFFTPKNVKLFFTLFKMGSMAFISVGVFF